MYVWLKCVSDITPTLMGVVGANISGNFRVGVHGGNHYDFYSCDSYHVPRYLYEGTWAKIREVRSLPKSRITQFHHNFISWRELNVLYDNIKPDSLVNRHRLATASYFCDNVGKLGFDNRVSAITVLVYIALAPLFALHHLMNIMVESRSPDEFMSNLKFEGGAAKQLQNVFRCDLAVVFELQVLRNRVYDQVNWGRERVNRTLPSTVPLDSKTVFKHACTIFSSAKRSGHTPRRMSWSEYWAMRWSHMPTGSVVSQYDDDNRLKKALPKDARVKAAWYAASGMKEHSRWLSRDPEIYASTSTKYEWGKVRALYGCDVTSFLHSDFAMGDCEELMPACFPIGPRANERYVKKIISTFSDGVPLCYDYDDFNSQHSTSAMVAVIRAWQHVFAESLSTEQQKSLEWTAQSVMHQYVRYNECGVTERIKGTLLSGWRLTSFINTVLNRVYLAEAGVGELTNYALHNGDDVFATTKNVHNAMELIRRSKALGVRAQVSKTNIGTIGEFLRIDTRARVKTGAQYLPRAVSTATHGRIETAPANDFRELVSSFRERCQALKDRGGSTEVADLLLEQSIKYVLHLFNTSWEIYHAITTFHPIQGGMDETSDVGPMKLVPVMKGDEKMSIEPFLAIKRGVDDYANYVVKRFGLRYDVPNRMQMLIAAVSALSKPKTSYKLVKEDDIHIEAHRGLYKAWHNSKFVTRAALIRSLGYVASKQLPGLSDEVARMIRNSRDPVRLMGILL